MAWFTKPRAPKGLVGPSGTESIGGNGHSGIPCWQWRGAIAGPSRRLAAGADHPWPGVRIEGGARSGRRRCSLARGGKEAGSCSGSGRCGKGAPIGWMAVRKRSVPFGERPSVLAGAGGVAGVGAGAEDRQAVGQSTLLAMSPAAGNAQAVGRPNRSPRWSSADEG